MDFTALAEVQGLLSSIYNSHLITTCKYSSKGPSVFFLSPQAFQYAECLYINSETYTYNRKKEKLQGAL